MSTHQQKFAQISNLTEQNLWNVLLVCFQTFNNNISKCSYSKQILGNAKKKIKLDTSVKRYADSKVKWRHFLINGRHTINNFNIKKM